jgi:putative membrane protein insertion efficiency factor
VLIACAGVVLLNAQRVALAGIRSYQRILAPLAADIGVRCRFSPSCSVYAERVIERDGALRGGWLALKRIARCGPWTPSGTRNPP